MMLPRAACTYQRTATVGDSAPVGGGTRETFHRIGPRGNCRSIKAHVRARKIERHAREKEEIEARDEGELSHYIAAPDARY